MTTGTARGIRNNNPGNIRYSANVQWQGQTGFDGTLDSPGFVTFDTAEHGIRAMAVILGNYKKKYMLCTVRGLISRWAPNNENNTDAYISSVCQAVNVGPDEWLNLRSLYVMTELVSAIIKHENGVMPYSVETIQGGVSLALGTAT